MDKTYRIADINIRIKTPFEYEMDDRYKNFLVQEENTEADFVVTFEECQKALKLEKSFFEIGENRYYLKTGEIIEEYWRGIDKFPFRWLNMGSIKDIENDKKTIRWTCSYLLGEENNFRYSSLVFRHIGLNCIMNLMATMLFHCSFIRVRKKGILFSGPSGIGKSTQADLWNKVEKAEIINGDRAAIRKQEGQWRAYGLPYAGSSGIFKNEFAEIGAIVILKKGAENKIRKLQMREKYFSIYSEVFHNSWNKELQLITLEMIEKLIREVHVIELTCISDESAVNCLKEYLQKEGILS